MNLEKTLALIFGGEGAERKISEQSAAHVLKETLVSQNVIKIGITAAGDWYLFAGDTDDIESGAWQERADLLTPVYPARFNSVGGFLKKDGGFIEVSAAFPLLHGDFGEDGIIQGALKCAHIKYIGSDVVSSSLTSDKAYTKIVAEYLSIPTAPWFIPAKRDASGVRREAERRLGYPFFIKPRRLGSSIGASPVFKRGDFGTAFENAMRLSSGQIMIESCVDVKAELEVAYYRGAKTIISEPGVINSHGKFYDYGAKYENEESPDIKLGGVDRATARLVKHYARTIADFLGLGNISRIDFFLTPTGEIYFNEINSVPGMTKGSLYPKLCELSGNFKASFVEDLIFQDILQ